MEVRMVKLGRIQIKNPIVASSGALAFGRGYGWERPLVKLGIIKPNLLGAVITKTLTYKPWAGNYRGWNPWQVLKPLKSGWVNAFGLTNHGINWFIANEFPHYNFNNLIVSITDPEPGNIVKMLRELNNVDIMAVEINLSCPNTPAWVGLQCAGKITQQLLTAAREVSKHPIIAKIGFLTTDDRKQLSEVLCKSNVDAVDMINTIPFASMYPGKKSPLRFGGGVSGKCIREFGLEQVSWFAEYTDLSVIGGGGIGSDSDAKQYLEAGAKAVAIGSAHIVRPWISTYIAKSF